MGQRRYTPFGSDRPVSGANDIGDEERFTSQRRIDAGGGNILSELYHYGARWYLPGVGIFTQPDSIVPDYKNPQALNRYTYVLNNPLRYTDPSGRTEEEDYYIFVGGYRTARDSNSSDWGAMIKLLGLENMEGINFTYFEWESGWAGAGTASIDRSTADAAASLNALIQRSGRQNVTLVGHSKGGALIMEYLAQLAEGKIQKADAPIVPKAAIALDSPLSGNIFSELAKFQRWESGPGVTRFNRDRLASLPQRLAAEDLTVSVLTLDNPNDPIGHSRISGIPFKSIELGDRVPGHLWDAQNVHGLLQRSSIAAASIRWPFGYGNW